MGHLHAILEKHTARAPLHGLDGIDADTLHSSSAQRLLHSSSLRVVWGDAECLCICAVLAVLVVTSQ
eukprot:SAG25_NODE_11300_length_308_cov_0.473684_1_plen_66_part_10